jgi:hypothetical protein
MTIAYDSGSSGIMPLIALRESHWRISSQIHLSSGPDGAEEEVSDKRSFKQSIFQDFSTSIILFCRHRLQGMMFLMSLSTP